MAKTTKPAKKAKATSNTIALLENGKVYGNLVNAQEVSLFRINELAKATIDGMEYSLQIGEFSTDLKKFATRAKKYIKFLSNVIVPENLTPTFDEFNKPNGLIDENEKFRKDTEKSLMKAYTFTPNEVKNIASMSQSKFMESLKSRKFIGTEINLVADKLGIEPSKLLTNGK